MSVTTTDNARVTTVRHLLADYELHHSQPSDEEAAPAPAPDAHPAPADTVNPPDWQDQYRRVPPYRPTQDQYDESRTTANNGIEHNFIRVMFTGESLEPCGHGVAIPMLTRRRCGLGSRYSSVLAEHRWEDQP